MRWLFCRRCTGLFRSPVIVALCPTARASAHIPVPPEPPAPRAVGRARTPNHPLRMHRRKSFVIDERDQLSEDRP
jgi:hypothetical protein